MPNDNDDEVAARGILYLLIFQQLGQLVRWSWGYHVLLAPKDKYDQDEEETADSRIERGSFRYSDNQEDHSDQTLIGVGMDGEMVTPSSSGSSGESVHDGSHFESESHTAVCSRDQSYTKLPMMADVQNAKGKDSLMPPPNGVDHFPRVISNGHLTSFADVVAEPETTLIGRYRQSIASFFKRIGCFVQGKFRQLFEALPMPLQKFIRIVYSAVGRFLYGLWGFMNPPLWAMLVAVIVASVPPLQHLFFDEGTFVRNSVTRAIDQSGNVAVPLILVVLGANLARNTLPEEAIEETDDPNEEKKLIIASLLSRMLLPTMIMAPLLAMAAKYLSVSILADPIFVVVCFLLTGAPSALQLAQICQINNVFMGAMSSVLFQSYVVWYVSPSTSLIFSIISLVLIHQNRILPSTLILVMCALQVVSWATT